MHAHLPGYMTQYNMAIFQFHPEIGIGQILENLTLHLDDVFLAHPLSPGDEITTLEICLLEQAFVLMGHDIGLHLCHEVHRHHYDDQ